MTDVRLPQLVFSTRAAMPRSGTDFDRRVVAESPGIPAAARGEFTRRADLVGTIARTELDRPVYTFSPLDAGGERRWLFARTVSIGRYRGGHQLLTHGLLLDSWHLDAMEGNPFLLDGGLGGGSPFLDSHPGADRELSSLRLPLPTLATSRRTNLRRLDFLASELAGYDGDFAALFKGLAADEPVAYVLDRPDPLLAEWLLLHLHPDDRHETSFHTFYCHGRSVPYRLLLVAPPDARAVRGQFRPLHVVEEGEGGTAPIGESVRELRRRSTGDLERTVRRYRVTFLASGEFPPLSRVDAELCLRSGLSLPLTADEERRLQQLRRRSGEQDRLPDAIQTLAAAWPTEHRRYAELASAVAESLPFPTPEELRQCVDDLRERDARELWATLVLFAADTPNGPLTTPRARADAWLAVAARGSERALLSLLAPAGGGVDPAAVPVLARYLRDAAHLVPPGKVGRLNSLVSVLLDEPLEGLGPLGTSPSAVSTLLAATAEALVARCNDGRALSSDRMARWLERACPHIPDAAAPAAGRLLAACAHTGDRELLRGAISHLRTASQTGEGLVWVALGEAVTLLRPSIEGAAIGPEALDLLRALTGLVAETTDETGRTPRAEATDEALAAVFLPALVVYHRLGGARAGRLAEELPPLRQVWLRWLTDVFTAGRTEAVFSDPEWVHLLEDDLQRHPVVGRVPVGGDGSTPDDRRRVLLRLAWHQWSDLVNLEGKASASEGRLLRLTLAGGRAHHQAIEAVVPEGLKKVAFDLLREAHWKEEAPQTYGRDA